MRSLLALLLMLYAMPSVAADIYSSEGLARERPSVEYGSIRSRAWLPWKVCSLFDEGTDKKFRCSILLALGRKARGRSDFFNLQEQEFVPPYVIASYFKDQFPECGRCGARSFKSVSIGWAPLGKVANGVTLLRQWQELADAATGLECRAGECRRIVRVAGNARVGLAACDSLQVASFIGPPSNCEVIAVREGKSWWLRVYTGSTWGRCRSTVDCNTGNYVASVSLPSGGNNLSREDVLKRLGEEFQARWQMSTQLFPGINPYAVKAISGRRRSKFWGSSVREEVSVTVLVSDPYFLEDISATSHAGSPFEKTSENAGNVVPKLAVPRSAVIARRGDIDITFEAMVNDYNKDADEYWHSPSKQQMEALERALNSTLRHVLDGACRSLKLNFILVDTTTFRCVVP
jgi:hypothetical protein